MPRIHLLSLGAQFKGGSHAVCSTLLKIVIGYGEVVTITTNEVSRC